MSSPIWNEPEVNVLVVHDHRMKMIMSLEQLNSIDDVRSFLEGTRAVIFGVAATKKGVIAGCKKRW
jgi:hypothetical protein